MSLCAQTISLIVVFVLTPLQLAGMGRERYGLCALAASTASYFTLFDLGGGWAVMRFIPRYRSEGRRRDSDEAFSVALVVSFAAGLAGAVAIIAAAPQVALLFHTTLEHRGDAVSAVRVAGLWLPSALVQGVLSGAGRAIGRFRVWAGLSAGSVILFNILWLAVARSSGSPADVMWVQAGVSLVVAVVWAAVLWGDDDGPRLRWPRSGRLAAELIRFSALSSVGQLGQMLLVTVGTIGVAFAVGAASIVYYAIPLSFAQRLSLASTAIATVLFPTISEKREELRSAYDRLISDAHILSATATIALSSFLFWAGGSGIALWISPAFAVRATGPVRALAIGFGALSLSLIYQVDLEATGRIATTASLSLAAGVIGVSAGLLLAVGFGETGGAIGIAIGLILLSAAIVNAGVRNGSRSSRRDLTWTAIALVALFAAGGSAHAAATRLPQFPERTWADLVLTSLAILLVVGAFGRKLIRPVEP